MKSYYDHGYLYYYDFHIKLWTIFLVDEYGNQLSDEADHHPRKAELKKVYPQLEFKELTEFKKTEDWKESKNNLVIKI